jgi:hypothetical protein
LFDSLFIESVSLCDGLIKLVKEVNSLSFFEQGCLHVFEIDEIYQMLFDFGVGTDYLDPLCIFLKRQGGGYWNSFGGTSGEAETIGIILAGMTGLGNCKLLFCKYPGGFSCGVNRT